MQLLVRFWFANLRRSRGGFDLAFFLSHSGPFSRSQSLGPSRVRAGNRCHPYDRFNSYARLGDGATPCLDAAGRYIACNRIDKVGGRLSSQTAKPASQVWCSLCPIMPCSWKNRGPVRLYLRAIHREVESEMELHDACPWRPSPSGETLEAAKSP